MDKEYCKLHKRPFSMCCGVCDMRYSYMGRTHLLDFFDAGARGDSMPPIAGDDIQALAAYQHGKQFIWRGECACHPAKG